MGSDSLIWVRVGNQPISIRTAAGHGYKPGQAVGLSFDVSKSSIFDKDTEQRL
jgi:ABC-type sugar transport system ATPase subunit